MTRKYRPHLLHYAIRPTEASDSNERDDSERTLGDVVGSFPTRLVPIVLFALVLFVAWLYSS